MKKIVVFGASGGTGIEVVNQALEAGYHVTAIIRDTESFPICHQRLKRVKGDVLEPKTFEMSLNSVDAVISCLGVQHRKPTNVYSQGISNIIQGMKNENITRMICISAGGVEVAPNNSLIMKFLIKYVLQRIFKNSYADMLKMEEILKNHEINWTVVRPPRLQNGEKTGKYRIAVNEFLNRMSSLKRSDLADFMLKHLDDRKTFRSKVEISY